MCDVRKKLILANVAIMKYKNWQISRGTNENVFDGFSTTLLMKLLYLSCLFTMKDNTAKTYRKTPFGVLDRWIAFPNGPAEEGIYSAIDRQPMPTINYNIGKADGHKYSEETNIEKINAYYDCTLDESSDVLTKLVNQYNLQNERTQVENGFDELVNKIGTRIDVSTPEKNNLTIEYLSKLSHLILWNGALNRNAKKLATDNIQLLQDEYSKLLTRIEPQAV
jgi:hypothetical protein